MSDVFNSLSNRVRLRIQEKASDGAEWPKFAMSMREIAKQADVSPATLSRFMAGRPITSDCLDRLDSWLCNGRVLYSDDKQ